MAIEKTKNQIRDKCSDLFEKTIPLIDENDKISIIGSIASGKTFMCENIAKYLSLKGGILLISDNQTTYYLNGEIKSKVQNINIDFSDIISGDFKTIILDDITVVVNG